MKTKTPPKKNPWKTASLIIGIICFILIFYGSYLERNKEETYDFQGLEIQESQMTFIREVMKNYETFIVCNIEENKCRIIPREKD